MNWRVGCGGRAHRRNILAAFPDERLHVVALIMRWRYPKAYPGRHLAALKQTV